MSARESLFAAPDLTAVGDELEEAIRQAIARLEACGLTAAQSDEFVKECVFNAWMRASVYAADEKCICPSDLLARGGFKGGCPVHG